MWHLLQLLLSLPQLLGRYVLPLLLVLDVLEEALGDGLLLCVGAAGPACLDALDLAEEDPVDGVVAEGLGQQDAHRTVVDGVAHHAAAHADPVTDQLKGLLIHGLEPLLEHLLVLQREVRVVGQQQDLVEHRRGEPLGLDEQQGVIDRLRGGISLRGNGGCTCRLYLLRSFCLSFRIVLRR